MPTRTAVPEAAATLHEADPQAEGQRRAADKPGVFRGFLFALSPSLALWVVIAWLVIQTFR